MYRENSPTCDKQSLRLVLSIIMQKKWCINSIDIKTAFLQNDSQISIFKCFLTLKIMCATTELFFGSKSIKCEYFFLVYGSCI